MVQVKGYWIQDVSVDDGWKIFCSWSELLDGPIEHYIRLPYYKVTDLEGNEITDTDDSDKSLGTT